MNLITTGKKVITVPNKNRTVLNRKCYTLAMVNGTSAEAASTTIAKDDDTEIELINAYTKDKGKLKVKKKPEEASGWATGRVVTLP